ncbi:MAG TPA: hypothetical protein VFJ48_09565 [Casimicrobiaceae bacterium]|nr:hypothetical protein [Casimicrobiaceae bacterium]
MNISLRMAMMMSAIFGALSLGYAVYGYVSLSDITDPTQASDARGFVWFWAFLASVAIGLGVLAWWIERAQRKESGR